MSCFLVLFVSTFAASDAAERAREYDPKTITFRMDARKVKQLDACAECDRRDRSYLLNEAVDRYLEVRQLQLARIEEGLCQAAVGNLIKHSEVVSRLRKRHGTR